MISEETRRKMSEAAKARVARGILPDNTGKPAWNKGKTANTDSRVLQYAQAQTGQKRTGNFVAPTHWQGEGNPWYGKSRSKEKSPRYNGEHHNRKYKDYSNKVMWLTERMYVEKKDVINPNNHPRTPSGVPGGYQIDHMISIHEGFHTNIPPEDLAKVENLRMIPWEENLKKGKNSVR